MGRAHNVCGYTIPHSDIFWRKMISRTSLPCSFLSLTMCIIAMIVVLLLYTTRVSHVYSTKAEVLIVLQPSTAVSRDLGPPPITSAQKHGESYTHKGDSFTANEANATTDMSIHKSNTAQQKHKKSHAHQNEGHSLPVKKTKSTADMSQNSNEEDVPPLPETLPYAVYLKSIDDIQKELWTRKLHRFLKGLDRSITPHVNMVFGDSNHTELVLNWIIAAQVRLNPPLHNIMVLSNDQPLCSFLESKKLKLTCIAVPPESFLASTGAKSYEQGVKTRFVVLRVMNYWGYDVASYDSDAVIRRNPQPLYENNPEAQIFTAASYNPPSSPDIWGFSICGGTLFVKSHPSTEKVWRYIHNTTKDECEQCLWNHAMQALGVRWNVSANDQPLCKVTSGWQSSEPIPSIVFPQTMFCRLCCRRRYMPNYYIVHRNKNKHLDTSLKYQRLTEYESWFLRDNWRDLVSSSWQGKSWLVRIYKR